MLRSLKITYGSYTVGSDQQTAILDGGYSIQATEDGDVVTFAAIIVASSDATFASKVSALEAAFATPRQLLKIEQGSSTLRSWDPSDNSGFNAAPQAIKDQHAADTGRTRRYLITVVVQHPPLLSGQNGRRKASVRLAYGPQEKIEVLFAGEYTAVSSNSALAQYRAQFDTYAAAFLTGLGGVFEKVEEVLVEDDPNKVLQYQTKFREIIFAQVAGTTNVAAIVEHTVLLSSSLEAPGDWNPDTVRLTDVEASYDCYVKKSTTNLAALWRNTLRPYVIGLAQSTYSPKAIALVADTPSFDLANNHISARVRLKVAVGTNNILEARVQEEIADEGGHVFTEPWDGQDFSAYVDKAPVVRERTITKHFRVLGGSSTPKTYKPRATTGWVFVRGLGRTSPESLGTKDAEQMQTTLVDEIVTERFVVSPRGGGGGGGGAFDVPGGVFIDGSDGSGAFDAPGGVLFGPGV